MMDASIPPASSVKISVVDTIRVSRYSQKPPLFRGVASSGVPDNSEPANDVNRERVARSMVLELYSEEE